MVNEITNYANLIKPAVERKSSTIVIQINQTVFFDKAQ
jgi:hypothetical protein